jgi:hypothetical protein
MYANKVIDIRTGKVYSSAKEVADEFNIPHSTVRCWLNGTRKNYSSFKLLKTQDNDEGRSASELQDTK